ncbi:conjugal transfer protein TraC, partial [Bacillus thuringiensis]|nr:conjugal transfer protein TraC [Bacillus thuringiensis]
FRVGDSSVWIQTDPSDKEMMFIESNEAVPQELLNNMKKVQGYAG